MNNDKLIIKHWSKFILTFGKSNNDFICKDIKELEDRYQFELESKHTQNSYWFDLYRFKEPNGGYRLICTNSKYKGSDDTKKWLQLETIQSMGSLKMIMDDIIATLSFEEFLSVTNI
jgi:hypothetical protein